MITIITGLPRSGKTAYTVEKLLMPFAGKPQIAVDPDGNNVEIHRTIHTNINGLLLDHQKIDADNLLNWHEWAKEGDLIVFDEVQKPWPLKATGSAKTLAIETLETHGHMGVDFIVMTQHPMLIESALVRLGGRHLHVRKVGNSRFATVYEWDGVSRTLLYKNAVAKFPYRRSKAVEKMYISSRLHTKQPRRIPALVFGAALAVLGLATIGPMAYGRLTDRLNPSQVAAVAPPSPSAAPSAVLVASTALTPAETPLLPPVAFGDVSGCIASASRCTCFDTAGKIVPTDPGVCRAGSVTAGLYLGAVQVVAR